MSTQPNIVILFGAQKDHECLKKDIPFYLSEFGNNTLIEHLVDSQSSNLNPAKIICMLPEADIKKYHLRNMIAQINPLATVLPVYHSTKGAACTALLASEWIDDDTELLILSANGHIDIPFDTVTNQFRAEGYDAGVIIFKSLHPRYSFVRLDDTGDVVEVAEKNPISSNALAGFYWFDSGKTFVQAAKNMIRKDASVNDSFFIAPALNELILLQKRIGTYSVQPNQYHPLRNQPQIFNYSLASESI